MKKIVEYLLYFFVEYKCFHISIQTKLLLWFFSMVVEQTSTTFPPLFTGLWVASPFPQYFWFLFSIAILLLDHIYLCNGKQIQAYLILLMQKNLARLWLVYPSKTKLQCNRATPCKYIRIDMSGKEKIFTEWIWWFKIKDNIGEKAQMTPWKN